MSSLRYVQPWRVIRLHMRMALMPIVEAFAWPMFRYCNYYQSGKLRYEMNTRWRLMNECNLMASLWLVHVFFRFCHFLICWVFITVSSWPNQNIWVSRKVLHQWFDHAISSSWLRWSRSQWSRRKFFKESATRHDNIVHIPWRHWTIRRMNHRHHPPRLRHPLLLMSSWSYMIISWPLRKMSK